jgi:hypothetical protein
MDNSTEYFYTTSRATEEIALEQGFEGREFILYDKWHSPDNQEYAPFEGNALAWRFPKTPHNAALMDYAIGDVVRHHEDDFTQYGV